MMTEIRLCGLPVSVEDTTAGAEDLKEMLALFTVHGGAKRGEPSFRISVRRKEKEPETLKGPRFSIEGFSFVRDEEGGLCILNPSFGDGYGVCSPDWSVLTLYVAGSHPQQLVRNLFMTGFYARLCQFGGLFVHGALVKWQGQGILFTASSGGGKSTHAELWRHHLGARIINGDKVFLRDFEDEVRGYGSLWAGSSPYVVNDDAPVKGIVVLKKGKENAIRRLRSQELLSEAGTHIFYPGWDEELMGLALKNMDRILCRVPVYELVCRPEAEAARLVRDTLMASGKNT